jgi:hypothetical protein
MTATQLALVPPGFCTVCTVTRLSVADVGGVCLFCAEDPARPTAKSGQCRQCNQRAMPGRSLCLPCQNARNVENRHKRGVYKTRRQSYGPRAAVAGGE